MFGELIIHSFIYSKNIGLLLWHQRLEINSKKPAIALSALVELQILGGR